MTRSVGVLFVHGIGKQSPGMTLSSMGDPLISWMRAWSRGHGVGDVRVLTTPEQPGEPRHVDAEWTDEAELRRLVLAECWWAETFSPPSLKQVLVWAPLMAWQAMFRVGRFLWGPAVAFLVVLYVLTVDTIVLFVWGALGALLAVMLLLPLVLVAAYVVLRILPGTGRMATALGGILTGHLGDAWVLRSSETRFAAMRGRCLSDLAWLSERCDRVIVVAHSQGSVVAAETLAATASPRCEVLVTVGSAIRLLRVPGDDPVERIRQRRPTMRWLNVYSQLDPVSAGPIAMSGAYPVEIIAQNTGSSLAAHVTYPTNLEGFQSVVFAALRYAARLSDDEVDLPMPEVRAFSEVEEREFRLALRLRENRAVAKSFLRFVTPLTVPGIALLLLSWEWPDTAGDLIRTTKLLPDWLADLSGRGLGADHGPASFAVVTALALTVTYQATVVGAVHRWWDRRATNQLAAGAPSTRITIPVSMLLLAVLPLPAVAVWGTRAEGHDHAWSYVAAAGAVALMAITLLGAHAAEYPDTEYGDAPGQFLRRQMAPAFAAFEPKISNIDGALAWRAEARIDAAADSIAAHLAQALGASARHLRVGERELTLPTGATLVLLPATFIRPPEGDAGGGAVFESTLPGRPPVDAFVLVDLTPRDAVPAQDESPVLDPGQLDYYVVVDPLIGTRTTGPFPFSAVTRADLVAAGSGPLRLEDLAGALAAVAATRS